MKAKKQQYLFAIFVIISLSCGISLRDVVAFVEIFISSMKRDVRSIYWSVYEAFVAIDDGISLNISDHHHSFEKHRFECQEKVCLKEIKLY